MKGINASGVGFSSIDENEEGFDWTNVGNKSDEADATERINVHSLFIKDVDDEYFLTFACNMGTISFVVLGASFRALGVVAYFSSPPQSPAIVMSKLEPYPTILLSG